MRIMIVPPSHRLYGGTTIIAGGVDRRFAAPQAAHGRTLRLIAFGSTDDVPAANGL
jgi:hypothetical protein